MAGLKAKGPIVHVHVINQEFSKFINEIRPQKVHKFFDNGFL